MRFSAFVVCKRFKLNESERNLAALCAKGDTQAQQELYLRYAARLHVVCRRYAGNADDAADLLQDAFLKAFDKMAGFHFSGEGSLYAWLRRLTVNLALDRIRKKRLVRIPLQELPESDLPDPPDEAVSAIPMETMLEMVSSLPPERRAVFNLYCMEGWSHREIAKALGITEKGSAAILHQARTQIKRKIHQFLTAQV